MRTRQQRWWINVPGFRPISCPIWVRELVNFAAGVVSTVIAELVGKHYGLW